MRKEREEQMHRCLEAVLSGPNMLTCDRLGKFKSAMKAMSMADLPVTDIVANEQADIDVGAPALMRLNIVKKTLQSSVSREAIMLRQDEPRQR